MSRMMMGISGRIVTMMRKMTVMMMMMAMTMRMITMSMTMLAWMVWCTDSH